MDRNCLPSKLPLTRLGSSADESLLRDDAGRGRFIVLEGLGAVGKSTIAPMLADALGGAALDTVIPELTTVRRFMDEQNSVAARLHFWMAANYLVSDLVRQALRFGRDIVIESYFYRTLATHAALGIGELPTVDWNRAVRPDIAIELTLSEDERRRRLAARIRPGRRGHWSELEEHDVATTRRVYGAFGLTRVDATGRTPAEVVVLAEQVIERAEVDRA